MVPSACARPSRNRSEVARAIGENKGVPSPSSSGATEMITRSTTPPAKQGATTSDPPASHTPRFELVRNSATISLEGIGRALFGCAPERYGQLTREEQARCPPPGEGLARLPDQHLLYPPKSHSRDAAMWAEAVAAKNFMPNCPPGNGELVVDCMNRQLREERMRAKQALAEYQFQKERRNAPPPPPKPPWVGAVQPGR